MLFSVNHAIEQSKRSEADPSSSVLGQVNGSSNGSRGNEVGGSSSASKGVTKKQGNVSLSPDMM